MCELILKFGTVIQEMSLKVFSFDSHFVCLQNHLCNFNRGLYGEHLLKNILNLDQWFRWVLGYSNFRSRIYLVQWSGAICVILGREYYGDHLCKDVTQKFIDDTQTDLNSSDWYF